jgi:hypothetical protein
MTTSSTTDIAIYYTRVSCEYCNPDRHCYDPPCHILLMSSIPALMVLSTILSVPSTNHNKKNDQTEPVNKLTIAKVALHIPFPVELYWV